MATTPPEGFEIIPVTDVNERIQIGDVLWDEEEADWLPPSRAEVGDYASGYYAVARRARPAKPAPQPPRPRRIRTPRARNR